MCPFTDEMTIVLVCVHLHMGTHVITQRHVATQKVICFYLVRTTLDSDFVVV